MLNKSVATLPLLSIMAMLTACSSGSGGYHFFEKALDSPVASKPLNTQGLKDQAKQDAEFVVKHKFYRNDFDVKNYQITIGDKTYKEDQVVDLKDLGANPGIAPAVTITDINESFDAYGKDGQKLGNIETTRKAYLYQQQYSIIGALEPSSHKVNGEKFIDDPCQQNCDTPLFVGESTKNLPTAGRANYQGVAWQRTTGGNTPYTLGSLNYTVDFEAKNGSGKISLPTETGITKDITLEKANISKITEQTKNALDGSSMPGTGIVGEATQGTTKGQYNLGFFGQAAEEIAGYVNLDNTNKNVDIAFSGVKESK